MKQYTNESQTAKLIELGLPKPKFEIETQLCNIKGQPLRAATIVGDYSIGELIEMLPPRYNDEDLEINRDWRFERWVVFYRGDDTTAATELIDALYDMVVKLKEERVI